MRPLKALSKPTAYPYSTDLSTQAKLQASLEGGKKFKFVPKKGSVLRKKLVALFGTALTPSRWDLLGCLLVIAKNDTAHKSFETIKECKGTLQEKATTYREAAPELVRAYGKFCSFCEQLLPGEIEVEHCVPKAPYPLFTLCWENFLLACSPCNTSKSNDPPRKVKWITATTELGMYKQIREHYLWPTSADAWQQLKPQLMHASPGASKPDWELVPNDDSVQKGIEITSADLLTRTVIAKMKINNKVGEYRLEAQIVAGPYTPAKNSLTFFGLHKNGTTGSLTADCRMYNRTLAWLEAVAYLSPLKDNNSVSLYQTLWPLIRLAAAKGHFSVWVTVLDRLIGDADVPDPKNKKKTKTKFRAAFLRDMEPVYPNTRIQDMTGQT